MPLPSRVPYLAVLCFSVAATCAAQGQDTDRGPDTIHVTSDLVVLDVVVTDAKGNIVPGLKKDDFIVLQDGSPQTIRNFDSWADRGPLPDVPKLDRFGRPDWGDAPLTIFVLDELNTPFDEKSYSAAMLRKYLLSQPASLKTPAMLMVVNDYGYHPLQEYTRDRDLLIRKLDTRPPSIPTKLSTNENNLLLRQSFALLRQIAIASQGLREHKNIIWIGRGFPALDPASLSEKSQASLQAAIKDTVSLLLNARVTVYKVDPMPTTTQLSRVDQGNTLALAGDSMGLAGDTPSAGEDPMADNFNFNNFAVATGGHYFYGLNDLNRFIDLSLRQGNEFYTLAYRPPKATVDGAFLNISIKMIPPGLTAHTRQGYYAEVGPRPEPSLEDLDFDLGLAAAGQMQYAGVSANVVAIQPARSAGAVSVTFQIEDRTLRWESASGGSVASFTTVLVALDAKHQILSSNAYKMHPFMAERDNALLATGLLTVRDDVAVGPKVRFLRVVIRDSSGRIGTADVDAGKLQELLEKMSFPSRGMRR